MDLQPFEFPKKIKHESLKTKKYVFIGKEKILTNGNLRDVVAKAIEFQMQEATKAKIDEWIKNF